MSLDVAELSAFYGKPLGLVASRLVARSLMRIWEDTQGLSLLGLGYTTPYLPLFATGCDRVAAFMPAAQGVTHWPDESRPKVALTDPLMLPLSDGSFDRVLVVHALETVENPQELLYELNRILTPSGRLIIVCPNRRGLWARMDGTPFGQGQPFSRRQLRGLLRDTSFAAESWSEILYVPPLDNMLLLRGAGLIERCGERLSLPFSGVHVVEAVKQVYRPVAMGKRSRHPRLRPVFGPLPASLDAARDLP